MLWTNYILKKPQFRALIYISLFLPHLKVRLGFIPGGDFLTPKALEVIKRAERKLTIIPIVFILLRIWGTIRFFRFLYYLPEDPPAIEFLVFLQVRRLSYHIMLLQLACQLYNNRARLYFTIIIILINENLLNDLKDAQGIYLILGIQGVGGG